MAPIKFGVGQSVLRKEDDALIRGKGRYTDDHAPQACDARAGAALAARACEIHHRCRPRPRPAGGGHDPDGRGRQGSRRSAVPVQPGSRSVHRPALSDPRPRRGAPCRRCRRLRGRRDHRSGPRCDRGDRGRLDAAAGGGRRRQRGEEGRAAGLARSCRQRAVRRADRRQEGDRGGVRQGACGRRNIDRQSARRHQLHGNARGGLRIRRQARSSDADDRQPGQPSAARNPCRNGPEDAARKDAGDLPGCRRRLRHQAVSLSRIRADRGRRAQTAQDGEVDRRPRRSLHGRRARPRQRHHGADGARRGRQVPRRWTSI